MNPDREELVKLADEAYKRFPDVTEPFDGHPLGKIVQNNGALRYAFVDGAQFGRRLASSDGGVKGEPVALAKIVEEHLDSHTFKKNDDGSITIDRAGMILTMSEDERFNTVPPADAGMQEALLDRQRYQRLRVLGCAPAYTKHLEERSVLRFTNLDEFVDADLSSHPSRGEAKQSVTEGAYGAAVELAYGLLWVVGCDRSTPGGNALYLARKALLEQLDKSGQSRGITAARKELHDDKAGCGGVGYSVFGWVPPDRGSRADNGASDASAGGGASNSLAAVRHDGDSEGTTRSDGLSEPLTAPGATTKSDGIVESRHEAVATHLPSGDVEAALVAGADGPAVGVAPGPSDPSSTRSEVTIESIAYPVRVAILERYSTMNALTREAIGDAAAEAMLDQFEIRRK